MSGWISLHRSILDWEWYDDLNVSRLFIHFILKANHAHGKWKGIDIERGSFITSLDKLSKETGLTVSQIRTCIKKLKSTNEIASKSHSQHTVIYIKNYESYQDNDKQSSNAVANESQTDSKQIATNNKNNNNNNENKDNKETKDAIDFTILQMTNDELSELKRIRRKNKGGAITQRVANALAKEFNLAFDIGYSADEVLTEWETRGWKSFKSEWLKPKGSQSGFSQVTQRSLQNLEGDW